MNEYEAMIQITAENEEQMRQMLWEMLRIHGMKTREVRVIELMTKAMNK